MPRLFTGFELPDEVTDALADLRGGLPGARWIDEDNYHLTLRFVGDIDRPTANELAETLDEVVAGPITVTLEALDSFGGDRPRALVARARPSRELKELQADHERRVRGLGLPPETRKYTPHVTLARLRDVHPLAVADWLTTRAIRPLTFTAERFVLFSSRDSVGGGPYRVEAAYPLM